MNEKPDDQKPNSTEKGLTCKDPDPELSPDEIGKFKYMMGNYRYLEAFQFEQQCLQRKRLNILADMTQSLLKSSRNLEQINMSLSKSSRRLEKLTFVTVIITLISLAVVGYSVLIAINTYNDATRPSNLVIDLSSQKGSFDDIRHIYLLGGPPETRPDNIQMGIWNTGARVAENITVTVSFDPQNASLYDIHSISLCSGQFCTTKGSPAQIRAIEPNGFYKVNLSLDIFAKNLTASGKDLYLTIDITDPNSNHNLSYYYKVKCS